jgi:hypothetical protein
MSGFGGMMVASYIPSTISTVTYANMVFNLDAAGYGALPGNVITTSASFDGSTQYLTVPHNSGLDLSASTAWTIEGWVYWSGVNTQANFIEKDGVSGVRTPSYGIQMDGSGNVRASVSDGTTEQTITSTTALTANTWTHIAFTLNSGSIYLYQGGTRANFAVLSQTIVDGGGNVFIGYQQGQDSTYYLGGRLSYIRLNANTAVYTANFVPSTSTLRPISGTQLLLPLVATPFMDISTNESTITNIGTVTTTASAPTLTAVTTDLTGTYAMTRTGLSISWKSTGTGGYFEKNNSTGTDHITGGPNYNAIQSYTVLMAYQGDTRSGGRLLNSGSEASNDWTAGVYFNGATYSKNVWYPSAEVRLNGDTFSPNSGWNFLWGTYDKTNGNAHVYIAASGVNSTVGPTDVYKYANVGMGSTHGFNQLRLFSRYFNGEVQSGNIGLVRVYDGVMPLAQIQSTWANLHSRFGI